MPRALSNIEYVTFLDEVKPDTLGLPAWGGITQWGGEYVLMFQMPTGEWALSDVTDGIPYGGTVIPINTYIANVTKYISPSGWSVWDVGAESMQTALQAVASIGQLASQATQFSVQQVADALQKVLSGASKGLGSSILPLAVIAIAIVFLYVNPKKAS
jgi:hypothetical protein